MGMKSSLIDTLAERIGILDISARAPGKDPLWPKRWRARARTSSASADVVAWGDTLEQAVVALADALEKKQAARRPS